MHRYEELVALRIADQERIKARLQKQGQVILALDGLQPDVGHEVLWVVRDCLSEEILLARPLLSSTQGDVTALLQEVKRLLEELEVPVTGVISDGEETIGSAVAFVFPDVPHQLCQFHYLKDATKPLYDADRHAKTELKKQLRGVRPIERALEEHKTPENEAIRGYCLAVRASLTDDGRSPLDAPGLRLYERVTQISDSIGRVQEKKITSGFKTVIPTADERAAGDGSAVGTSAAHLPAGASSSADPLQRAAAHRGSGAHTLPRVRQADAEAASRAGTAWGGHHAFLSHHQELRHRSLPVLRCRGLAVHQQ